MYIEIVVFVVAIIWLIVLSGLMVRIYLYFNRLTGTVKKGNLLQILDRVIELERVNSKSVDNLKKEVLRIDENNLSDIQKVSIVRFNPFKELGGDHSFVVVMLDGRDNGFMITSLHTREKTRVYLKEIISGNAKLDLSQEENKALTKAQNSK
jgi:hypothetical protein